MPQRQLCLRCGFRTFFRKRARLPSQGPPRLFRSLRSSRSSRDLALFLPFFSLAPGLPCNDPFLHSQRVGFFPGSFRCETPCFYRLCLPAALFSESYKFLSLGSYSARFAFLNGPNTRRFFDRPPQAQSFLNLFLLFPSAEVPFPNA